MGCSCFSAKDSGQLENLTRVCRDTDGQRPHRLLFLDAALLLVHYFPGSVCCVSPGSAAVICSGSVVQ